MKKSVFIIIILTILPIALQSAGAKDGNILLLDAVRFGNHKLVNNAIKNGADVNKVDYAHFLKNTPLHQASNSGHIEVVNALILAKASTEVRNDDKETPLHSAARAGHIEIVNALLLAKATIEATDHRQWTPLHWSARTGRTEVVKALILAKAGIDARNIFLATPLHLAENIEVAKALILEAATIAARDKFEETPLHWAARSGNTELVKVLLDVGANSTLLNKDNQSIFSLITESWVIKPNEKEQLTKIIKDHQAYQEFILKEVPKLFVEQRDQFNIPEPIAKLITQYAFGICAADQNKERNKHDKI